MTLRQEWLCAPCSRFVHGYCRREIGQSLEIYDMFRKQLNVLEAAAKEALAKYGSYYTDDGAIAMKDVLEAGLKEVERLVDG